MVGEVAVAVLEAVAAALVVVGFWVVGNDNNQRVLVITVPSSEYE